MYGQLVMDILWVTFGGPIQEVAQQAIGRFQSYFVAAASFQGFSTKNMLAADAN